MEITRLLEKDHRKVDKLFAQIERARSPERQKALFEKIRFELEVHADVEEAVLYPRVAVLKPMAAIETHSEKEHADVRRKLVKIGGLSPESRLWKEQLRQLKKAVEHHVSEEEGTLFPLMREHLTDKHLRDLGREAAAAKRTGHVRPTTRRAA